VVLGRFSHIASERKAGGQGPAEDLGLRVDIGDGVQEQVAVADLDLVALVIEALEVWTKTYRSL
jgi:hypothetical protein